MELRQIQYFIQLYKDQNITKASKTLFISQQGLSKSIHRLEDELGFLLFERSINGVTPTMEAIKLHHYFEKIDRSFSELTQAIDLLKRPNILHIGAYHGYALSSADGIFCRFQQSYPNINIQYKEYDNKNLSELLRTNQIKIAILNGEVPVDLENHMTILKEPIYLVMQKSHEFAKQDFLYLHDLKEDRLVILDSFQSFNTEIYNHPSIPDYAVETVTLYEFFPYLSCGKCIGFCTKDIIDRYHYPNLVSIPLLTPEGTSYYIESYIVTRPKKDLDLVTEMFIQHYNSLIHQL